MKSNIFPLALILFLLSCKKHQPVPQAEVLEELSTNLLKPNHDEFNRHVDSLYYYVEAIHNQQFQQSYFENAQKQFELTLLAWNKINLFETEVIANTYIHYRIQKWPVDTTYILSTLASSSVIDSAMIVNQSSRRKGLGAIEYLLFRNASWDSLQNSSQARDYLFQTTSILKSHKEYLQNLWNNSEYTYFESNQGSGVYTAANFFYNNYVLKLELMLHEKLGIPAGFDQNTVQDIHLVESCFALKSLSILKEDILTMQRIFDGYNGRGLAAICRGNGGENTADLISQKWQSIRQKTEALQSSDLKEAIQYESNELYTIYTEMKSLLANIKYDLPQYMDATLLYSSNDGD